MASKKVKKSPIRKNIESALKELRKLARQKNGRKSFTVVDLKLPRNTTYLELLNYLVDNAEELDKLLDKDESWTATYLDNKMRHPYGSIKELARKQMTYDATKSYGGKRSGQVHDELLDGFKIIKLGGGEAGVRKYNKRKRSEVKKRMEEREKQYQTSKEVASKIAGKKVTTRFEITNTLLSFAENVAKRQSELEKLVAKQQKQIAKLLKGGKKSATKRVSKAGAKKSVGGSKKRVTASNNRKPTKGKGKASKGKQAAKSSASRAKRSNTKRKVRKGN